MIIIPAIDIHEGLCVRATQDATQDAIRPEVVYAPDPVEVARGWARQGASWLHVIDLEGILAGYPIQLDVIRAITTVGVPVQVGGGFRTVEDLEAGFACGVARVLLDAAGLPAATEATRRFGNRIAALLIVKNGSVAADGVASSSDPISLGQAIVASGIRRFVYSDLGRDGTLAGPDIPALEAFVRGVAVPVIAAGGIASHADLAALGRVGVEAVVIGRALYEGRLQLRTLTAAAHTFTEADEKAEEDSRS